MCSVGLRWYVWGIRRMRDMNWDITHRKGKKTHQDMEEWISSIHFLFESHTHAQATTYVQYDYLSWSVLTLGAGLCWFDNLPIQLWSHSPGRDMWPVVRMDCYNRVLFFSFFQRFLVVFLCWFPCTVKTKYYLFFVSFVGILHAEKCHWISVCKHNWCQVTQSLQEHGSMS